MIERPLKVLSSRVNVILLLVLVAFYIFVVYQNYIVHIGIVHPEGVGLLGRDFVNYYNGSVLAQQGELDTLFSAQGYFSYLKDTYGDAFSFHNWSYPPHTLLYIYPLSYLPYKLAYLIWCIGGIGVVFYACKRLINNKGDALVLALAPCALANIYFGQNGFITGALFILSFAIMDKRPILAGVLIGLLTFKPQLGLLVPVALVLARQWRVVFSAGATMFTLIIISILAFGLEPWTAYFEDVIPLQGEILRTAGPPFSLMVPSTYMSFKLFGFSEAVSMGVQSLSAMFAVVSVAFAWWRQRPFGLQLACLFVSTMLLSPYVVNYDMMIIAPAAYLYCQYLKQIEAPNFLTHVVFAASVSMLPWMGMQMGDMGLPVTPFLLMGFNAAILYQLHKAPSQKRGSFLVWNTKLSNA